MIPARLQDIRHKTQLLRLLTKIADNNFLAQNLYFKGGTCASMLNFLDRFSIDLDFDLNPKADVLKIRSELEKTFANLDFKVSQQSQKVPEYFLKYIAPDNERNTLKIDAFGSVFKTNVYKPQYLPEIDRTLNCQTIETMFANKLVAASERFEKHHTVAGRDIYDIHYFFNAGYSFESAVIEERTGLTTKKYLQRLVKLIEKEVTETMINEDLNALLPLDKFQKIRKILKQEVITILKSQI